MGWTKHSQNKKANKSFFFKKVLNIFSLQRNASRLKLPQDPISPPFSIAKMSNLQLTLKVGIDMGEGEH